MDIPFDENATSLSFKLKYPAHSQLVAVVSDASGFGTGGTSVATVVADTDDNSCFDPATNSQTAWAFDIEPRNQITQCGDTRIFWWHKEDVVGATQFYGVIPGGQSFNISGSAVTDVPSAGTGFTWKANVRVGTTLMMIGGDSRAVGNAGSALFLVANGPNGDATCLDETSPSSTPGTPAGGSYPTGTGSSGNSGGSNDDDSGGANVGAIVGGVIGGLVVIVAALLALFFYRRRQKVKHRKREKPDLLTEDDEGDEGEGTNRESRNNLPQFYRPEPFTVPDPTLASMYGDGATEDGRRPVSGTATSLYTQSATPDGTVALGYGTGGSVAAGAGMGMGMAASSTGTGRKGQPPRSMRPVNIIQHDDAGPSGLPPRMEEEAETIELPPAYTALRTDSTPSPSTSQIQQAPQHPLGPPPLA